MEEARMLPATCKLALIDDEALLMKPLVKVARLVNEEAPLTSKVDEALSGPATCKLAPKEEDAKACRPPSARTDKALAPLLRTERSSV